jgi:glutamine synthetase
MSLSDLNGKNVFYAPAGRYELSQEAIYFMGGIIKHIKAISAVTNPTVNSYKRLVPGYEAPINIAWSTGNRSPLIRIPAKRGASTRIELRSPDPSCNPYFASALCLQAGLKGIEEKIMPPEPVNQNIYEMNKEERKAAGIENLPGSLEAALEEFKKDEFIRAALGKHVSERFIEAKEQEIQQYNERVHKWELDQYLTRF